MAATAALVSFRLGGPDGVSVQAATWGRALERLGFRVRRVAGELSDGLRPGDVVLPGLAMAGEQAPAPDGQGPGGAALPEPAPLEKALEDALEGADVVVVENLLSLPLNLAASRALTAVLAGPARAGRVVLHHHDLAWQRPELAHVTELPPRLPGAVHAVINDFSRAELADRGLGAVTVRNAFDLDAPAGRREATRAALGVGPDDVLVLQPTRAIARKNIPVALALAEGLAERLAPTVRFWLPGPAEEGYASTLERLVGAARVPVLLHPPPALRLPGGPGVSPWTPGGPGVSPWTPGGPGVSPWTTAGRGSMADAYAACDLVTFPSTGEEGFGQPVIESVWARRPLAVARYPALEEILALGFSFLPAGDADAVAAALLRPDADVLSANLALARAHFSLDALVERLRSLLEVHLP